MHAGLSGLSTGGNACLSGISTRCSDGTTRLWTSYTCLLAYPCHGPRLLDPVLLPLVCVRYHRQDTTVPLISIPTSVAMLGLGFLHPRDGNEQLVLPPGSVGDQLLLVVLDVHFLGGVSKCVLSLELKL